MDFENDKMFKEFKQLSLDFHKEVSDALVDLLEGKLKIVMQDYIKKGLPLFTEQGILLYVFKTFYESMEETTPQQAKLLYDLADELAKIKNGSGNLNQS